MLNACKIQIISLSVVVALLSTPILSLAKAGGGYRGGRGGFSQSGGASSNSVGSRGSRTFESNGFRPIERSVAASGTNTRTPQSGNTATAATSAAPPVAQPSFFHRHPLLSGIAAGMAGSWIGHMLFGAPASPAATHEGGGDLAKQDEGYATGQSGPSMGFLLLMMALVGGGIYFFYKKRQGFLNPALTDFGHTNPVIKGNAPAWVPASVGVLSPAPSTEPRLRDGDEAEFRRLLVEIQTAWSRQDVQRLRHMTTPEMCQYFTGKLAENVSAGVENRVEDILVTRAEVRECWEEEARLYATVLLQWKARDYVRSLTKSTTDPGYLIEGDDRTATEVFEAWTFVRHREGKWLLSAIQQVD